ncbi:MAG: hypothetical protein JWR24_2769 [Actinoallomurus sp.]|jgi:hypothetical protein|nr:hypothetical protein [Actinoallomurus sp.]
MGLTSSVRSLLKRQHYLSRTAARRHTTMSWDSGCADPAAARIAGKKGRDGPRAVLVNATFTARDTQW